MMQIFKQLLLEPLTALDDAHGDARAEQVSRTGSMKKSETKRQKAELPPDPALTQEFVKVFSQDYTSVNRREAVRDSGDLLRL